MNVRPRTTVSIAGGTAVAALALSGCGLLGPGSVPADDVEAQISTLLEQEIGEAPESVDCPEDLPGEEGASITCSVSVMGETTDVTATVTTVEGDTVNFDVEVVE